MSKFFGEVFHIAYVTKDLDQEVDRWLASGVGPFYYAKGLKLNSKYRGERNDLIISVAFAYTGSLMLELVVQDNDVPSSFREYLEHTPQGGLHHIAYICENLESAVKDAAARGTQFVPVQEFLGADGKPVEIYMEPKGAKSSVFTQIVLPSAWDDAFAELKDICGAWDGKTPKRNMYDLLSPDLRGALDVA